jgi:ApaG protein
MSSAVVHKIRIEVDTLFRPDLSDVMEGSFFHNYTIRIENIGLSRVQLLRRYWRIDHLLIGSAVVSGDGVVGEQPILGQGENFTYTSGCEMHTSFGRMNGYYTFRDVETGELFRVAIPEFTLVFPTLLN